MDQPVGRITDCLLDRGYLTAAQIGNALGIQRSAPGRRFVDILVEEGFLSAQQGPGPVWSAGVPPAATG